MSARTAISMLVLGLFAVTLSTVTLSTVAEPPALQGPDAFASIPDPGERSKALFSEAGRVLLHPRCVNCHPAGDEPRQGDEGKPHEPWVQRGKIGMGVPGLRCNACHSTENFDFGGLPGGVPGAPGWHLAPESMAWEGRTIGELCEQLKDPDRSHMDLDGLVRHVSEDRLVGWAWDPGGGREAPPGSQRQLGELIRAWVETGAVCPTIPDPES